MPVGILAEILAASRAKAQSIFLFKPPAEAGGYYDQYTLGEAGVIIIGLQSIVTPAFRRGLGETLYWALALKTHESLN